jgi:EAL domain-containing protein (putative c-di-GMP-specific phosphodiesterase class I)
MTDAEIRAEDDRLITGDVARAVEERELIAYYQPVMELQSNKVVAAEALVRWTMPDSTVVPAALFVPSLERTDTITGLDWYMAEEVCTFLEEAAGTPACVPTSLNFSVRHAQDPDFATKLIETAKWHNVEPRLVRAEYQAASLLACDPAMDALFASIVAHGFTGTVDNFNDGPDHLEALADKGVTVVKVASACWRNATDAELKDLLGVVDRRGLTISCEGVEQASEARRLRAIGFRYAQGYHFAVPQNRTSFEAFCA